MEEVIVVVNFDIRAVLLFADNTARGAVGPPNLPPAAVSQLHISEYRFTAAPCSALTTRDDTPAGAQE